MIAISRVLGNVVVAARGDVNAQMLDRVITDLAEDQGNLHLMIDLREANSIDPDAYDRIADLAEGVRLRGGRLMLSGPHGAIRHAVERTGPGVAEPILGTLIVDDEKDMRMLLRAVIAASREGLTVVGEAATGEEAIERWADSGADVILMDQRLPDMTGLEAAQEIFLEDPSQPIVLFSAFLDSTTTQEASDIGITAVVDKADISDVPMTLRWWGGANRSN